MIPDYHQLSAVNHDAPHAIRNASMSTMHTLAYRPFLEPIPLEGFWLLLLVPLILAVAIIYKSVKIENMALLPRQVVMMAAQILAFMVMAAAALWLVVELV